MQGLSRADEKVLIILFTPQKNAFEGRDVCSGLIYQTK